MQTRGEMSLIRFSFYIQTKGSALFLIYIFYKYILLIRTRCFFPCKTLKSFDLSSIVSSIFETVWHWRWLISSKIIRLRQEKEHFTIDFKQNKFQELVSKYLLWTSIFLYKKKSILLFPFFLSFCCCRWLSWYSGCRNWIQDVLVNMKKSKKKRLKNKQTMDGILI